MARAIAATAISNKFVIGPARLTNTMSRRGWRNRAGFTGTGFAYQHREAGQRPHQRERDRPERIDVRDRVQREATGPLGGVVTEPGRHDAVADLVEDDRDDQTGEEDHRFAKRRHGSAGLRGRTRCTAPGVGHRLQGAYSGSADRTPHPSCSPPVNPASSTASLISPSPGPRGRRPTPHLTAPASPDWNRRTRRPKVRFPSGPCPSSVSRSRRRSCSSWSWAHSPCGDVPAMPSSVPIAPARFSLARACGRHTPPAAARAT